MSQRKALHRCRQQSWTCQTYRSFFSQEGDQGVLLIAISGGYTKSNGDAVRVHEQSHFHDRERAVFLACAILFVIFGLFDFKIEVCAVVIDNAGFSEGEGGAVFEQTALDIIGFLRNDREGTVNVMKFKRRRLYKFIRIFKAALFGGWIKNPRINQA